MAICNAFIEPLNLQCLLVNTLSETSTIFIAVALFVLATLASFFRMSSGVFFILIGMFMMFIAITLEVTSILLLFLTIGSVVVFATLTKLWKN